MNAAELELLQAYLACGLFGAVLGGLAGTFVMARLWSRWEARECQRRATEPGADWPRPLARFVTITLPVGSEEAAFDQGMASTLALPADVPENRRAVPQNPFARAHRAATRLSDAWEAGVQAGLAQKGVQP